MNLPGTVPKTGPATHPVMPPLPTVDPATPPPPRLTRGAAPKDPAPEPKPAKPWYDWAEQASAFLSFVVAANKGIMLPYSRFTAVQQSEDKFVFQCGEYRVRAKFSSKFPLDVFLLHLHFQYVVRVFAIKGEVSLEAVKIDPETGAEIPL